MLVCKRAFVASPPWAPSSVDGTQSTPNSYPWLLGVFYYLRLALRCTAYAMATACFTGRVLASVLIFFLNAFLLADLTRGMMAHLLLCQQCGVEVKVPQYRVNTFK